MTSINSQKKFSSFVLKKQRPSTPQHTVALNLWWIRISSIYFFFLRLTRECDHNFAFSLSLSLRCFSQEDKSSYISFLYVRPSETDRNTPITYSTVNTQQTWKITRVKTVKSQISRYKTRKMRLPFHSIQLNRLRFFLVIKK